jgi:hypothetical protein
MGATRAMKSVKKDVTHAMKAIKPTGVKTKAMKAMKATKKHVKAKPAMKTKTAMKATITATKDTDATIDLEAEELQPYANIVEAWPVISDATDVD